MPRRRAVVTGSTSGIGLAIAEGLAEVGYDILLNGFGDPSALIDRLQSTYDVRVVHSSADLASAVGCRELINHAAALGPIDILVNNAGIQHIAPIESFPAERWDAILALNLTAAFHLTGAVLPAMRASGFGRIVNIASVHGLVGSRDKSAYVAAKHGLVGLTKVTALETAGSGITANAICPGFVLTPLIEAQLAARMDSDQLARAEAEQALLAAKQPSGKFVEARDIAALTIFLCSAAAAHITGAALPIDGAWTAQ
jgi:3-hydroxybutyrate dehydrogenase